LSPYEGYYRVALLLRFEEANANTSNALLKTLEEPNPRVVLIITASDAESLNPTIVSRCEVLRLRPLSLEVASTSLQAHLKINPEEARLLAHLSNGRPGVALNYHQHIEQQRSRQDLLNALFDLLSGNRLERFNSAGKLNKEWRDGNKELTYDHLLVGISLWRDVLLKVSGSATPITNLDYSSQIDAIASQLDLSTAYQIIKRYEETISLLMGNVNHRLALEVLFLDLPYFPHRLVEISPSDD
jgi:DNA polymerase III subunit delta'